MSRVLSLGVCVVVAALASAGPLAAAEKVVLKSIHMCCDGCAEEVATILGKVEGVSGVTTDKKAKSATFTQRIVRVPGSGGVSGIGVA